MNPEEKEWNKFEKVFCKSLKKRDERIRRDERKKILEYLENRKKIDLGHLIHINVIRYICGRWRKVNFKEFGYKVLKEEGLSDWKIEFYDPDWNEGYCHIEQKLIKIGRNCKRWLMIHEIVHAKLEPIKYGHYSTKFINEFERLCKKHKITYKRELQRLRRLEIK